MPMTAEQIEIRELKKRIERIDIKNGYFKKGYGSVDARFLEPFSLIEKLNQSNQIKYPINKLCIAQELKAIMMNEFSE
jgi:hypothetical protein